MRWEKERDRRYTEVNIEKEKALGIKEKADLAALQLARDIQTYKDEKANELREQINSERGLYVTKEELHSAIREIDISIKHLDNLSSINQGQNQGIKLTTGSLISIIGILGIIFTIIYEFRVVGH
jgi:hypothetical protein